MCDANAPTLALGAGPLKMPSERVLMKEELLTFKRFLVA